MQNQDHRYCSVVIVLLYTASGNMAIVHIYEESDCHTASNYNGELIRSLLTSLLLHTIITLSATHPAGITVHSNNLRVVSQGNNSLQPLPESQTDTLLAFWNILNSLPTQIQ
jgi:hypothetical protein